MKQTFSERVLYMALLDNRIDQDVFHYLTQWAESEDWPKNRKGLLDYAYNLLRQDIIEPEDYLNIKECAE